MLGKISKKGSSKKDQAIHFLFKAKERRRKRLARLSIEEKVAIIIKLQKAAYPILAGRKKNQLPPWGTAP